MKVEDVVRSLLNKCCFGVCLLVFVESRINEIKVKNGLIKDLIE